MPFAAGPAKTGAVGPEGPGRARHPYLSTECFEAQKEESREG